MHKKSIVWRFFIVIVLLLVFFLTIGFMGQTFFFEQFYTYRKVSHMEQELESFASSFETENWDEPTLREEVSTFFRNTGSEIVIFHSETFEIFGEQFGLVVETANGNVEVPLTSIIYGGHAVDIDNLGLAVGMEISMEGRLEDGAFVPSLIHTDTGGEWINSFAGIATHRLEGTIIEATLPSDANISIAAQVTMFANAISRWRDNADVSHLTNQVTWEDSVDQNTGLTNKLFIRPIMDRQVIIFSMVSLQPIGEAVEVVRTFYVYMIGILLFLSALFAFYLAKYLAHNFKKINRVTKKMAELDFSETIEVTSEDEIGMLSKNINQLSENLRKTIGELQVANEKLQADIEKERKLEATRKEFISGVSHELKTPLSIIKSYSEAVKDKITKENTDYYVDVILNEAESMNVLVDDMLELAKLESGTYSVRKEPFSIIQLIDDVNFKLMFKLQDKDMDIDVDTDEDYTVLADRSKMEQVLVNFFTNAIRYGRENTTIVVRLLKEKEQLRISIENKGEPISQEKLEKIWDRFYRVDSARTRNTGGIGLGLSIVKNIFQLHEIDFGVENVEGGVSFYFYLPLG